MPLTSSFAETFARSAARREGTIPALTTAFRLCDGDGDDLPGHYVDRYGPCAVFSVYDDAGLDERTVTTRAHAVLEALQPSGVEAVYVKRFRRDRSRQGGHAPDDASNPVPRAGQVQPEVLLVKEHGVTFEVRPWDGLSTGLFLEHRDHRRALASFGASRVLNLFAYTCGFSVPSTLAGAHVTNVDVSARYLDWGRRNHAHNDVPAERVHYVRMDATTYLAWAARRPDVRFDLVIIDPPTFGAADRRRGIPPWSIVQDYPALLQAAAQVLAPQGRIFAATNNRRLATGNTLVDLINETFGRTQQHPLPPWPSDVRERGRVAAVLFTPSPRPRHQRRR